MRTEEEIRRYLVTYTVVLEAIHDNDEEFPDIDIERKTFELEDELIKINKTFTARSSKLLNDKEERRD